MARAEILATVLLVFLHCDTWSAPVPVSSTTPPKQCQTDALLNLQNAFGLSSFNDQKMAGNFLHKVDVPFKKATFAMGCFWAPDSLYGVMKGVLRTRVGYTGGTKVNPTYKSLGDHTEAIDIDFDPTLVSYDQLLDVFWANHNPASQSTKQYSSFIYYHDDEQKSKATESLKAGEAKKKQTFLTKIVPATEFYEAEDYHQKYRLQQHRELTKLLGLSSLQDLVESHIAARLNGYIVGRGGVQQFNDEAPSLGINEELAKEIRNHVKRHEGQGLFC